MEKKLERDVNNKMLGGVASGLADYLNIEVVWVRVMFVCLAVFGLAGVWIYLIMWIAIPARPMGYSRFEADYRMPDDKNPVISEYNTPVPPKEGRGKPITGIVLIAIGICFLLSEFIQFPVWIMFAKMWPLIFVIIGLVILFKPDKPEVVYTEPVKPGEAPIPAEMTPTTTATSTTDNDNISEEKPDDKNESGGFPRDQPLT